MIDIVVSANITHNEKKAVLWGIIHYPHLLKVRNKMQNTQTDKNDADDGSKSEWVSETGRQKLTHD